MPTGNRPAITWHVLVRVKRKNSCRALQRATSACRAAAMLTRASTPCSLRIGHRQALSRCHLNQRNSACKSSQHWANERATRPLTHTQLASDLARRRCFRVQPRRWSCIRSGVNAERPDDLTSWSGTGMHDTAYVSLFDQFQCSTHSHIGVHSFRVYFR